MAISGLWAGTAPWHDSAGDICRQMLGMPADGGATVVVDAPAGLALASASMPLNSPCGRYQMLLEGQVHEVGSSHLLTSDQIMRMLVREGVQPLLGQLDGVFVLALWDRCEQQLVLARDPAGQRPLFYAWLREGWAFSSTLGGLRRAPGFVQSVDRGVLALFLRHGHVPAPYCIHTGAFKLDAGSFLPMRAAQVEAGNLAHVPELDQQRYWDPRQVSQAQTPVHRTRSMCDAIDQLDGLLHQAMANYRGEGCGGFLSGGVDSSLLLAIGQRGSAVPLPTVGIGFESDVHDESRWMQAVAKRLGTAHETLRFTADQVVPLVQQLPDVWEEPFADASQLPTLLASQALSARACVAVTGDGGDELFFGHRAYLRAVRLARISRWLPQSITGHIRRRARIHGEAGRLGGWAALLDECSGRDPVHHYLMRIARWRHPERLLPGVIEPSTVCGQGALDIGGCAEEVVQYLDFMMELGNGMMTKMESAGRACGLQTVSPFLERAVVEYAWQLPMAFKWRGREQKLILKELLCRYLPRELVYRPKRGFGPPIAAWLRGPLRGWAEALLAPGRLQAAGLADDGSVQRMWQAFQAGERRWHPLLWTLLMYLAWHERQIT